jgi:hypothetical protein
MRTSTVWCTTAAQQQRLEQVKTRVLRRILRLPCAVADDVLRMELGCRPYVSWMDQCKLEFAFRLATMAADSLPARVAAARWPRLARKGLSGMHASMVASLERAVGLNVAKLAAAAGASRASFKRAASGAVRKQDVEMRRKARSTVGHHLRVLGDPGEHANQLQRYLAALQVRSMPRWRLAYGQAPLSAGPVPDGTVPILPGAPGGDRASCSAGRAQPLMLSGRRCGLRWSKRWGGRRMSALRRLSRLTSSLRPCWETPSWVTVLRLSVDAVVQQYLAAQMRRRRSAVPAAAAAPGGACGQRPGRCGVPGVQQAVWPLCCCVITATGGTTTRAAWSRRCLVCLMMIGSAPAVLMRRPRWPPPCLSLPLPAAGPVPLPTMVWPARCVLASTVLPRCCCAMAATGGSTCSALACAGSARPLGIGTAQLVPDPLLIVIVIVVDIVITTLQGLESARASTKQAYAARKEAEARAAGAARRADGLEARAASAGLRLAVAVDQLADPTAGGGRLQQELSGARPAGAAHPAASRGAPAAACRAQPAGHASGGKAGSRRRQIECVGG